MRLGQGLGGLLLLWVHCAVATPPILFSQPEYESPVRGDPGDLLLLAGYGFAATDTVVYQAIADSTQPLTPPVEIPSLSTNIAGVAPTASTFNTPDSLTVSLPTAMQADASYALWVRNANGEWSNGVRINDARPMWITPDTTYSTQSIPGLPRYLKVVGRNLHPAPGSVTWVRLTGPGSFTLVAHNDQDASTSIERYVAQVDLPTALPVGSYTVEVSRDGVSWLPVTGQTLTVFPDPTPPTANFDVSAYGSCAADDGADDTPCIAAAIAAARLNGGGTVSFGPGTWDLSYSGTLSSVGPVTLDGLLVPVGVSLIGSKSGTTILQRDPSWNASTPNFTLQGNNVVQSITFRDANVYQQSATAAAMLRLGVAWNRAQLYSPNDPKEVSDVVITGNTFDKPFVAIADGGLPIDHLFVIGNELGGFTNSLAINGSQGNLGQPFHIDDSVIALNRFEPGSSFLPAQGQGALATGLGAGRRLDFSGNTADGTATRYLYDPVNDPRGWRAGFFFTDRGNQEQVLVSQNTATCTGDKAGDGEAITTDGSSFTAGLAAMQPVTTATATTVTIPGPLLLLQAGTNLPGNYFSQHWVQIAAGPGKGQVRRIVSYPLDATGQPLAPLTLSVTPAWDVVPGAGSMLVISRQFWQFYIVDNVVDQRQPLCTKGNANKPSGGKLQFYGQTADSVIEGNRQYDTSGINLGSGYSVPDPQYNSGAGTNLFSSVEIRANVIDGEYAWESDCSWGGIQATDAASPTAGFPPPVEEYGVAISHNTINRADGLHGGAIALTRGWYAGPPPSTWNLADNILVYANAINDVAGPPSQPVTGPLPFATSAYKMCPSDPVPRIGIRALDATIWNTVLSGNSCSNITTNLVDGGTASKRVCTSSSVVDSCECPVYLQGDYGNYTTARTLQMSYPTQQAAGSLNVIAINWANSTSRVSGVVDSVGNTYQLAVGPTRSASGSSQAIFYAANIRAASANTITVTFDSAAPTPSVRIGEYAGIQTSSPLDVATGAAVGSDANPVSAWITTANANDLLVSASDTGDELQIQTVGTTGPYHADVASAAAGSIVQIAAFKLAGGGGSNTQSLTAPSGLSATASTTPSATAPAAASVAQIDLTWNAASDNMGVAGYLVERCTGAGCVSFAQLASVGVPGYSDTGPFTPSTSYSYRVRALDVAGLASGYSATAVVTLP